MEKSAERLCLRCEKEIPKWRAKSEKFCNGVCRLKFREEERKRKIFDRALSVKTEGMITVHSCLASPLDPRIECRCRLTVTPEQAQVLIARGEAVDFGKRTQAFVGGPILLVGKMKRTPRVATLEKSHLERANYDVKYVRGKSVEELKKIAEANQAERAKEEKVRIEIYGLMTLLERIKAGKRFVGLKREPIDGRENDWGRPFEFAPEQRTCVGKDVPMSPRRADSEDQIDISETAESQTEVNESIEEAAETVPLEDMMAQEDLDEVLVEDE